jgi:hypothetical protein
MTHVTYAVPLTERVKGRKPVYRVIGSLPSLVTDGPRPGHWGIAVSIPTDRYIRPGAIINPHKELNRFLAWRARGTPYTYRA